MPKTYPQYFFQVTIILIYIFLTQRSFYFKKVNEFSLNNFAIKIKPNILPNPHPPPEKYESNQTEPNLVKQSWSGLWVDLILSIEPISKSNQYQPKPQFKLSLTLLSLSLFICWIIIKSFYLYNVKAASKYYFWYQDMLQKSSFTWTNSLHSW